MAGWALLVVGLLVAGGVNLVGVESMEITLALIAAGLVVAVIGVVMLVRGRRPA